MKKFLQITSSRPELFWRLYASLEAQPKMEGWQIVLSAQGWPDADAAKAWGLPLVRSFTPEPRGAVYLSRRDALYDWADAHTVWCMGDDDMEFTAETDYSAAVDWVWNNPGAGIVECGYKKDFASPDVLVALGQPGRWVPAPIVGMGGGMVFNYEVARAICKFGEQGVDYRPDDIHFGAASYASGRDNYRFYGSQCLHNWGQKGGMLEIHRANPWGAAFHPEYFETTGRTHFSLQQFELRYTEAMYKRHDEMSAKLGRVGVDQT